MARCAPPRDRLRPPRDRARHGLTPPAAQSSIAVWGYVMGATCLLLGVLWLAENRAAAARLGPLRDGVRGALGLAGLFAVAWLLVGNVWSHPPNICAHPHPHMGTCARARTHAHGPASSC